jgi:hypothetical protein
MGSLYETWLGIAGLAHIRAGSIFLWGRIASAVASKSIKPIKNADN